MVVNIPRGEMVNVMSKKPTTSMKRRDFLRAAGLGTVAGSVAMAMGGGEAEAGVLDENGKMPKRGYHETAHVKQYYELAKF